MKNKKKNNVWLVRKSTKYVIKKLPAPMLVHQVIKFLYEIGLYGP